MIRQALAAAILLAAAPAAAQSQQDDLDARYDRALAAGYKALMTCGAIKNADALRTTRSLESVERNELVGTYPELDAIMADLQTEVGPHSVSVAWDDAMPPRIAVSGGPSGCSLLPIGAEGGNPPETRLTSYGDRPPEQLPWPNGNLVPEHAVPPALSQSIAAAFSPDYGEGANTTAVVVLRGGELVAEQYKDGFGPLTPQRTWSVAKSLAATIVGAAVQRGEVSVEAPAAIEAWSKKGDPRGAITLDNLLRMASGRYSDTTGSRTDAIYIGGATVDERAATWPLLYKPNTYYRYANNDILMAIKAIAPGFAKHPPSELFHTIGMYSTIAETDWQGNYILSSQVWASARDLAKFGQLYLNDGVWNGKRILPENWRDYVSSPSGPQPGGPFGYGAGFWLFNNSDGVPPDTFAGMGNRGQYVVIVPSRDVVIVRRGEDPAGSPFDIAAFTRDVLASLDR